MEESINYYNLIISAYEGIILMDDYELKEYVLKDIKDYLNDYMKKSDIKYNYNLAYSLTKETNSLTKLQDALYLLNKMGNYQELKHLIKIRIQDLKRA